ncbi:translation initiation factor IF-5A [archaeon]|jgi:translation initiation factor 5A|nr:translation initiation factor IF-5A [archaeon]MBT4397323.1 translation initiation factor IF-5A [archaeon]MBT4440703.1 translation initiation factor IF-5A [archaeon]
MGEIKLIDATGAKPGRYVIFDGQACVVKNLDISRPGKHGHAKCRIEAVSITGGKKIVKVLPGHDHIESPVIEKRKAQVVSIDDDTANVMDLESYETFDLAIPADLKAKVKEGSNVMYWTVLEDKVMKQLAGD